MILPGPEPKDPAALLRIVSQRLREVAQAIRQEAIPVQGPVPQAMVPIAHLQELMDLAQIPRIGAG